MNEAWKKFTETTETVVAHLEKAAALYQESESLVPPDCDPSNPDAKEIADIMYDQAERSTAALKKLV